MMPLRQNQLLTAMTQIVLTPEQIADLTRLLLQRQTLLERALDLELHADDPSHVSITGESDADWAAADAEADVLIAKAERDANELTSMSLALDKIADGTYGVCEACGDDIGYPRLLAYPGARRCLGCQEKAEGLRHS